MALKIEAEISGLRLDAFLANKIENLSRNAAQKLIENRLVLCDGSPVKAIKPPKAKYMR